jgi:hypothetical protein
MKQNRFFPALLAAVAILVPSLCSAQSYPPVWSSSATYAAGDLVQYGGNWFRSVKALAAAGPEPSNGFGSWELNYIRSNTTLLVGVGQQFTSLQNAWGFALEARVADGAYLHFSLSSQHGALLDAFTGPFSLDHQSGSKISIIGDVPSHIYLGGEAGFPGTALSIDSGHTIASLSNVTILGQGKGYGLSATTNASINCTNVQVAFFATAVYALQGASVSFDPSSSLAGSASNTVIASQNANVVVSGITINNTSSSVMLTANAGGVIVAQSCTLNGNGGSKNVGVAAANQGYIDISDGTVENFTYGVQSYGHSFVNASYMTGSGNGTDIWAANNGVVNAAYANAPIKYTDSNTYSVIY